MFGDRLKAARKIAGLSLPKLANKLGDISKQSLSNYENNRRKPNSQILIRLAKELGIKPDFFVRESVIILKDFEYRKKSKLSKQDKEMIEERSRDLLERYSELENLLGINANFVNPIRDFNLKNIEDVEKAAQNLRDKWDLGINPIKNLVETLEDKEIKILQVDANISFDGLAVWNGNTPIIVVNKNINDIVRKRMTIAHELGHLLMKLNKVLSQKEKENYCFRFAGAFLIPKNVIIDELGGKRNQITKNEFIHLKNEFGISIQGLVRRAKDLEIISEVRYRNFCIKVRKIGWEKFELGEYVGDERPIRQDNLLYRAVTEEIISISKAAAIANKTIAELQGEIQILL